ncbi:carbohydrate kinase family protein [Microbacterium sp. NPDC089696]|uniref:carbohydrate kinase family protein n=1 Tax=Microbacterium sp. NPDC089696 TaxID=3364199 RepID=UPI00382068FB
MSDLTTLIPDAPARGTRATDLLVVGDTGIDMMVDVDALPGRDAKAIGRSLGIHPGGMGANFAVAAGQAESALRVSLFSRVGDDPFGIGCIRALAAAGVATEHVEVMAGELTWWCAVAVASDGEKSLLGGRTPASLPDASRVGSDVLEGTRWLHVLADVPGSEDLVRRARTAGAGTSVDIEGSFVGSDIDRARALLELADVAIVNSGAAQTLTGADADDEALARLLADTRHRVVVLTRGSKGSVLGASDADGSVSVWSQTSVAVPEVVDTTGAGDAFAGTVIASLLAGRPVEQSLTAAAEHAARTISHLGSRPGGVPGWPHTHDSPERGDTHD